jgi:hypothetical protein
MRNCKDAIKDIKKGLSYNWNFPEHYEGKIQEYLLSVLASISLEERYNLILKLSQELNKKEEDISNIILFSFFYMGEEILEILIILYSLKEDLEEKRLLYGCILNLLFLKGFSYYRLDEKIYKEELVYLLGLYKNMIR